LVVRISIMAPMLKMQSSFGSMKLALRILSCINLYDLLYIPGAVG
jgi:hypothetical protein